MKYICSVCNVPIRVTPMLKELIHDWPEQKESNQRYIDSECPKYLEHYKIILRRQVMALPLAKRQEVLDLFRSGKTIGEINILMGFETMMTAEIISMNIEDVQILRTEAK